MSDAIISVENLGKKYAIHHERGGGQRQRYSALRDVIAEKARSVLEKLKFGKQKSKPKTENRNESQLSTFPISALPPSEDFRALRDVSFSVRRGAVGMILPELTRPEEPIILTA